MEEGVERVAQNIRGNCPGWLNSVTSCTNCVRSVLQSTKGVDNWYSQSTMLNGSSASFVKAMGGTETAKAVYGVAIELGAGKVFKRI